MLKQTYEIESKYHHPNINKKSEMINKSKHENISVHEKLYNMKDEKQNKLMQKIIDTLPDFKPTINKKMPKFMNRKNEVINTSELKPGKNVNVITPKPKKKLKTNKQQSADYNTVSKYKVSKNTEKEDILFPSDDEGCHDCEEIDNDDDVIQQYKEALQLTDNDNKDDGEDVIQQYKEALQLSCKLNHNDNKDSGAIIDEKDKNKIDKYSQRIACIINK